MDIDTWPPGLGIGPTGERGLLGGVSLAYYFEDETSAPPSSGRARLNHATPASATHLFVHDVDRNGINLGGVLGAIAVGDVLKVQSEQAGGIFAIYSVAAASDEGTYFDYTLTYLGGGGTFGDGAAIGIGWGRRGPVGATGGSQNLLALDVQEGSTDEATDGLLPDVFVGFILDSTQWVLLEGGIESLDVDDGSTGTLELRIAEDGVGFTDYSACVVAATGADIKAPCFFKRRHQLVAGTYFCYMKKGGGAGVVARAPYFMQATLWTPL